MNRAFSRFYASLANRIIPEKVSQKKPFAPPNGPQPSEEEPLLDSSSPLQRVERKSGNEVWQRLLHIAAIFLLIAASRIVRLDLRELHPDEVWSVWQTFGTVDQIIRWTPYDWTPAFYLTVGAWRALTGANPVTLVVLSVFVYLIGVACLYRLARRLFGETAGIMAMLAYSALGYNVFISIFLRAYVFVLTLVVVALWMAVRYFENPTRRRAILLAVALAAPIYLHITGVFAVAMIGIFTLIFYPRRVRHWLLPGAITVALLVPVALWLWNTLSSAASKLGERSNLFQYQAFLEALFQDLIKIWRDLVGYEQATWIAFMIVAGVIIVTGWRTARQRLQTVGLAVWILSPIALMFVAQLFFAFNIRHLAWVSIGIALWLAWAFSSLPGRANVGIAVILTIGMFGPVNINEPDHDHVTALFKQMAREVRTGDVIILDPRNDILNAEEWDYYMLVYFPEGMTFAERPDIQRRVWYAFSTC
jgi:4-amino-4-deoxy-L-arabinose transferase-like glycosyltransferase